ncbi:hypothetical protein VTN49DRAFT_5849 [Thermomyces lanuginosus]|uniref:uncharacterized protein n=1 Tax=Thermomyces lanuginosus TaxID=5541 RepID=UPI0037437EF8
MLPTNPILRFTDSTGSSKLVEAPTFCPITTRFDNFTLSEIPTKKSLNNLTRLHHQIKAPADIFTKPLDETSFTSLRNLTKLLLSPSTKHRLQSASTDLFHVKHMPEAENPSPCNALVPPNVAQSANKYAKQSIEERQSYVQ